MGLFEGIEDEDGFVEWSEIEDSITVVTDTTVSGTDSDYYYFNFDNENLGWINCDYTG